MSCLEQHKAQKGFTLIEVMIALVILATGLLALMTMQIVSIKANAFSSEMTYAAMLGQSELEKVRNMNYASVVAVAPQAYNVPATLTKGVAYTVETQVQDNTPTTDMKRVTLIINWFSRPAGSEATTVLFTTRFSTVIKP